MTGTQLYAEQIRETFTGGPFSATLSGEQNSTTTGIQPCGHQMIVALPPKEDKTKGGLYMPQESRDIDHRRSIAVKVVAQGISCYHDKDRFPDGPWCQVGDWVMIGIYTGSHIFKIAGDDTEYRVINDDQVLAVVSGPDAVERV